MLTYARWKYALLVIVLMLSALYALPNMFVKDPSVQITANRTGVIDDALRTRVAAALATAHIAPKKIETANGNLLVRFANPDEQVKAADLLRTPLGNDYVVALNLASTAPHWLESVGAKPMQLGLDLQGGVHFMMQVDQKAAFDKRLDAVAEDVRVQLRDAGVRYDSVERRPDNSIVAQLAEADVEKARAVLAKSQATLDIATAGSTITVRINEAEQQRFALDAVEQNVSTLRNRINSIGVAEPLIQRQGTDRIVIQLPGVQDTAQAKRILGATATLEYRAAMEGDPREAIASGTIPPGFRAYNRRELGPDGKPMQVLLSKRVIASGDQLVGATSTTDPQSGTPAVLVHLNGVGGQRMFDFSSENVGKPMAVVFIERLPEVRMVDGKEVRSTRISEEVISVATIQGVLGKEFQTTGLGSAKEAADLALLLRSGSLAAPMDFVEERIVGPSLGRQNVESGLRAVLYSFLFTLVFFLFYYRVFGIITCLALMVNLLIVVAMLSLANATLSLPGMAGVALTVGMSVDANVLINERIREELRLGLPPQSAIAAGYDRAFGTIADANLTTVLAGLALFTFGTGPIKGFAITLVIGILSSMYTAVSVSRAFATLIYGRRRKLQSIAI